MGLYFRRSVRVGLLRFNYSTSGIGVSTGIRGFRVGTGPRGAYVHMGAGGVYYRQSLGGSTRRRENGTTRSPGLHPPAAEPADFSVGPMQEIDSTSVLELTDSSSQALLEEIQHRQSLPRVAPWIAAGAVVLLLILWSTGVRGLSLVLVAMVATGVYCWAGARDALRRTVILGYDLDPEVAERFESLVTCLQALGGAGGLWHIPAEAQVHDGKYHAGASTLVKRETVQPGLGQPPIIRTNLDVPFIRVGKQVLYFMPDRALLFEGSQVGAVSYGSLVIDVSTTRFVESDEVPTDAQIVDRTWQFVNKKGGPDRRFKNNRELPVALYEEIHLRSPSGLNEVLQVSRQGLGMPLAQAVAALAPLAESLTPLPEPVVSSKPSRDSRERLNEVTDQRAAAAHRGVATDSPEDLRRGKTAEVIVERGPAWEYRAFALALTDIVANPPTVPAPPMPTDLAASADVAAWATTQLEVPQQLFAVMERILNKEAQAAFGPPGQSGNEGAILQAAWNLGYQAAGARTWATAVRATPMPPRFRALRDEISRTVDQPLRELAAFGPDILASVERALRLPSEAPKSINLTLSFNLENQDALQRAMKAAFR